MIAPTMRGDAGRGRAGRHVHLDEDVAEAFPSDESVNEALRLVARLRAVGAGTALAPRVLRPVLALAPPAARLPAGPAPYDARRFLQPALPEDVAGIVAVRNAATTALTARFGTGDWSSPATEHEVASAMKTSIVLVAKEEGQIVATLRLGTRKPWVVDPESFQACARPVYLHDMVVAPTRQRTGLGKRCIDDAVACARDMQAGAIRVGVYDGDAGGAGFFVRSGFVEVARATRRGVGWVYLERGI
jgi:GNAT superfamily N-acetyltransferase